MGKISTLWVKLPEKAIQIFVGALLPGAIGISKVDIAMQAFFNVAPVGKLGSSVTGDGLDKLGRESGQNRNNGIFHCFGPAVWYLNGNIVPCLSLCQGGEAGFAFSLAAHNRIRFPVPGFLAAVYRLVSFTDGFPFAVFSSCFLGAVALSLAPQTLRFPFTKYFSYIQR